MGTTKAEKFTQYQNRLASFAKAIGHPARIAILQHLLNTRSCVCGDIVEHVPLSQSTVSQHLKELKAAGIIKGDVEGTKVCYCINEEVWIEVKEALNSFFDIYISNNNCC